MAATLRVRGWEKFQHYKHRNPIWIKCYVELLDRPAYVRLSPLGRAALHAIWLLAARLHNGIPADRWFVESRIGLQGVDFQELLDGDWLNVEGDASGLLAPLATRERSAMPEYRVEESRDRDPIANAIGAGRRPADALDDLDDRALMQLVRRHLYVPNRRAPKGWAEGRDVKILRQLRRRGHSGLQIGAAIEGLALMREASEFDWLPRGAKATMRALLNTRHGVRDLFSAAQDWYWKHAETGLEKQRAAERDAGVGKSQPQRVGDLLTAAMPPRAHP